MTLAELAADPARVAGVEPAAVPALLAELAALTLGLSSRLAASCNPSCNGDGALLTPDQAAAIAGVSRAWVWRRARRRDAAPWVAKLGRRTMRIRRGAFEAWLAREGRA